MADYITILSGEHWFKVKNPEEFQKCCQEILDQIGDYNVEVDEDSATIYGEGLNFSLAGSLEDPELFEEDDGSNHIQGLHNLIEEYALEPWTVEEVGWEKCRYVNHSKYEIGPTKEIFIIVLVEKGLVASTWIIEGTANLAIKTAEELAAKLNLNLENHDLAVDRPFKIQPGREINRNSERIWTWCPED